MSDVAVAVTPSGSANLGGRSRPCPEAPDPDGRPTFVAPPAAVTTMSDTALQRAVRAAVDEVANPDERLRVNQTIASLGWGDVLFVDIYTKSRAETLEDLDEALRKNVAVFTGQAFERTTIRWRVSS